MTASIGISPSAAERVRHLLVREGRDEAMLRVSVSGGGCSGFQYGFAFDTVRNEDDRIFSSDGVNVVVDEISLELLDGSTIDFVEDLAGAAFRVDNPNATASCGCGSSFAV